MNEERKHQTKYPKNPSVPATVSVGGPRLWNADEYPGLNVLSEEVRGCIRT